MPRQEKITVAAMPKPLADQVIVLTGASSGIGLATARMAAEQGARPSGAASRLGAAVAAVTGPRARLAKEFGMHIEERVVGDVVVLDLTGKITLGDGDELLTDKVNSLLNQGRKKIVLNLADVPYIDSAGLGEIVRTYTTVSRQGGNLKLLALTKRITDLLAITKLLTVFETYETESEAVQSFSAKA